MVSNATGGSYMTLPFSNSEAVKWALTSSPPLPIRCNQNIYSYIKPPFATIPNETRRQKSIAVHQQNHARYITSASQMRLQSPIYRRLSDTRVTHSAPSASNKVSWPSYNSLNDPHMQEYFLRRFGRCQTPITSPCSSFSRRQSSSSALSKLSPDHRRSISQMRSNTNILYKVSVMTGEKQNSGTKAKIYLTVNGTCGMIKKTRLFKKKSQKSKSSKSSFRFTKDSMHTFKIYSPDIGDIKSILVENSGSKKEDAWFLNKIEITNTAKKKMWSFHCYQWLSLFHNDGHAERKLFPQKLVKTEYEVVTVTGDVMDAGTNANVFITLFGKQGTSKKMQLKSKKLSFQKNESDTFRLKTNSVDPITKIHIEHDNTGFCPGWFLERVVITNLKGTKTPYYFPCGKWLARDEGDGSIGRDLIGSRDPLMIRKDNIYKVTVYTGNVKGAGTDACVFVTLFGEFSDSGERRLRGTRSSFERGKVDEFVIKCPSLGRLERIRIGHDNSGFKPGWFLDKVIVDDKDQGTVYKFLCNSWLATDEDDGHTYRYLCLFIDPNVPPSGYLFIISVVTSDMRHAGTDSNVFICLYGSSKKESCSGKIWLKDGKFERGKTDIFNVNVAILLSPVSKLEVGHDNSGRAPGWFLDHVIVDCPSTGIKQVFLCNRWLALNEDDGLIQRILYEEKSLRKTAEQMLPWFVFVYTGTKKHAGTNANVHMVVYGNNGKSDEISLDNKSNNFEEGAIDRFKINLIDIGTPYKIRIWHNDSGRFSGWFLEKVELQNIATKKQYVFNCQRWLATDEDDNQILRELPATGEGIKKTLPVINYKIEVYTGDVSGAGTDADIFLNIFGVLGDTGERFLTDSKTNRNKFERGKMDEFHIEAVTLMELKKIRIGHNCKYPGSGWFLNKVIITPSNNQNHTSIFECNRWFAVDEDDGATIREIFIGGSQMLKATTYNIQIKTGDVRGAGTDANVFIKILGTKDNTGAVQLTTSENHTNKFEQGHIDMFKFDAADVGEIKKIKIGHDSSHPSSGWFLDEVQIDVPSKGDRYIFPCHRWLDKGEDDGQTEIFLEPTRKESIEKCLPYEVTIWTGDMKDAGTDANVFIRLFGSKGKTEKYFLRNKADNFEAGMIDKFKIETCDVGRILKLQVGHDEKGAFSGWFLEKILIQHYGNKKKQKNTSDDCNKKSQRYENSKNKNQTKRPEEEEDGTKEKTIKDRIVEYWFFVNRWFSKNEDDEAIIRELIPTDEKGKPLPGTLEEIDYMVKIVTGDVMGAGTDANVFLNIYGEQGDTSDRQLSKSENVNKFERNQEDVFTLKAIDLGKLIKLKIYHDNKGGNAAWFLNSVEVINMKSKESYFFPCQRWLSTKDDDGQIIRELVPVDKSLKRKQSQSDSVREESGLEIKAAITTYYVKVMTGNVWGAGTDANVFMFLYGNIDNTGQMFLKSSIESKNKFERGNTDEFVLEAVNIGELKKIKIGHDNSGYGGSWFLEKVIIDCPSLGKTWTFPCGRWLALDKDDGKLEKELYPQEMATEEYIPCIPYEITTYTGDVSGASTDANVFIVLYGKTSSTQQKSLCANKKERKQRFKKNAIDKFVIELEDIGDDIEKIRIGHDDSGFATGWFLAKVEVRKLNSSGMGSKTFSFPCNRWLARNEDDGNIERELVPDKLSHELLGKNGKFIKKESVISNQLTATKYIVCVYTGDVRGGGTDASVFITIFGDKGDTGERKLFNSETYKNKFERNQMDKFTLEAVDLGKIYKMHIRHDNSMISPAWYLDKVEVTEFTSHKTYIFHCERWLAKNKDDGKIERSFYVKGYDGDMSSCATLNSQSVSKYGSVTSLDSLRSSKSFSKSSQSNKQMTQSLENVPEGSIIPYTFQVRTGDQEDHGTDSNVWIKVFGPGKKHTGCLPLEMMDKKQFKPGSVETFSIEAVDVDQINKIEVGHDGTSPNSGWFLKDIEIDLPTKGKHYRFVCNDWLAKNKGDNSTVKTFSCSDDTNSVVSYKALVPYEVTIHTGDVPGAGTDSKIFMTVFGEKGTSRTVQLEKTDNYFERDQVNTLKIELDDIAPLKKIRMSVDGANSRPDWYLKQVDLLNIKSGEHTIFLCDKWFSADKDDKKLQRDIPALDNQGKQVVAYTTYTIKIKTSDINGAGTSAGVFLILFGMYGDSSEISLTKPIGNNKPFQRGQLDIFEVKDILSLGKLGKLRIWHDNKGIGSAWHLSFVEVVDASSGSVYTFYCDKWLSKSNDDGQIIRELICSEKQSSNAKKKTEYSITVITTDKKDAGTIHNGWLILEGEQKMSSVFHMVNSAQQKILSRGNQDNFSFVGESLGRLQSCIVGAVQQKDTLSSSGNNSSKENKWHCNEILVTDQADGTKYTFACKSWIHVTNKFSKTDSLRLKVTNIEESQVSRIRKLNPVKYTVNVFTGDEKNSGTNANVSLTIFGENGDTGKRPLKQRFRDLFEKNQVDSFIIETVDLGKLTSVLIEHDNKGFHPGWFLDHIEISNMDSKETTIFPCRKWLDKEKEDGLIARKLLPQSN